MVEGERFGGVVGRQGAWVLYAPVCTTTLHTQRDSLEVNISVYFLTHVYSGTNNQGLTSGTQGMVSAIWISGVIHHHDMRDRNRSKQSPGKAQGATCQR